MIDRKKNVEISNADLLSSQTDIASKNLKKMLHNVLVAKDCIYTIDSIAVSYLQKSSITFANMVIYFKEITFESGR